MRQSLNPGTARPKYCPARASCAKHFGRSAEYAGMRMPAPSIGHGAGTIYWRGVRDHCAKYEFDRPKQWLMPQAHQLSAYTPPESGR